MFVRQLLNKLNTLSPLVVGIDPQLHLIHSSLFTNSFKELLLRQNKEPLTNQENNIFLNKWATLYLRYAKTIIDAVYDIVPAIKIQIAFFEPCGYHGIKVLSQIIQYAYSKNILVITDAKRGDIPTTAEAYALSYLGDNPLVEKPTKNYFNISSTLVSDALTINPYMGGDSLESFFVRSRNVTNSTKTKTNKSKGLFVLLKTSNLGSVDIQDQELKSGGKVYELVIKMIKKEIKGHQDIHKIGDYTNIGAVVGATFPKEAIHIRKELPHSFLLVPGFGFQQGDFSQIKVYLNDDGKGALFNISRGIIYPHKSNESNRSKNINVKSFKVRERYTWSELRQDIRVLALYYAELIKDRIG